MLFETDASSGTSHYRLRYTDSIDAPAVDFEQRLLARPRFRPSIPDTGVTTELPLFQQTAWLRCATRPIRLLQISNMAGEPMAQIAAELSQPRRAHWFQHGTVRAFGNSFTSQEMQILALEQFCELLRKEGIRRLRVQATRLELIDRLDFTSAARRAGFSLAEPTTVWRTLLWDLLSSEEELLKSLSDKTRAKIRHRSREQIEIRSLRGNPEWIPEMHRALNASFSRSAGTSLSHPEFDTLFKVAEEHPDLVLILGLFFVSNPNELLAFHISIRNGAVVEALSEGSIGNPELRKIPFSFFFKWKQQAWARENHSRLIDMGGVTDGGPSDPLAGISHFKRHFTRTEAEVGSEMIRDLAPVTCAVFDGLASTVNLLRARSFDKNHTTTGAAA